MKLVGILLISVICFSFCPEIEKTEPAVSEVTDISASNGFYIFVEDFTDRSNHKYIVQTKDSVQTIFNHFFESELALGQVDRPINIFNGKRNFYIARVNVFVKPNGKLGFKHLKYENPYIKPAKRQKLRTVTM
jgi:hypothetical protein